MTEKEILQDQRRIALQALGQLERLEEYMVQKGWLDNDKRTIIVRPPKPDKEYKPE